MQQRLAGKHWILMALCVLALLISPLSVIAAGTPVGSPAGTSGNLSAATNGASDENAEPTTAAPPLYERTVLWWPYTEGPVYGAIDRTLHGPDVIRLAVGAFHAGDSLDLPAELTGNTAGIARGLAQYFLVKLAGEDPGASRQVIESMGAVVVETIPVNAAIVRLDATNYDRVASSPAVSFIEPYHPAFRINPGVGHMKQLTPEAAASPVFELSVALFPGELTAPVAQAIERLGGTVRAAFDGAHPKLWISLNAGLIPQLARLEPVAMIAERGPVLPMAARGSNFLQSPAGLAGDFPYWEAGVDGDNAIITVDDSGLSVDAGDFSNTRADSGWNGSGGNSGPNVIADHRKIVAYRTAQFAGGGGDLSACDSAASGAFTHGQVVGGVAAGNATRDAVPAPDQPSPGAGYGAGFYDDNNNDGKFDEINDSAFDGIAKGARVVFVDAASGCPDAADPTLQPGNLNTVISQTSSQYGSHIHNFSFGSTAPPTGPQYSAGGDDIDAGINGAPINFVAIAAGNDGAADDGKFDVGKQGNEASCKNCIAVGASNGVNGGTWSFTSSGRGPGDRVLTLLFAEGADNSCRSEDAGETPAENQTGPATCRDAGTQLGTSFASPNMAGAAAVVRDYFAKGFYPDGTDRNSNNAAEQVGTISGALIKAVLIAGAQPLTGGRTVMPEDRFNFFWGYGRAQLNFSLPLSDFPGKTVSGLIVHDSGDGLDLDADGTVDSSAASLSLPTGLLPATPTTYTDQFEVLDANEDLVVALAWNEPVDTQGLIANDLDLRVRYCGADGTCGNGDDTVWSGNIFAEDFDRDGSIDNDLNGNGKSDGYFYSLEHRGPNDTWKDDVNNTEAVFIPTENNAQDKDGDGTLDMAVVQTGLYQIELERAAGSDSVLYAVAISGGVAAGSSVRFDSNPLVCNADVGVIVNETDDAADPSCNSTGGCSPTTISSRTTVEVLDTTDTVVDTETGIGFTQPDPDVLRFETSGRLPLTADLAPADNDGILSVDNGYKLRVTYQDSDTNRQSIATVDCQPSIEVQLIRQVGKDFPFNLVGGCDEDEYLDQGETFSIELEYFNLDPFDLIDAQISLRAVVPPATPDPNDPCREAQPDSPYVSIENPVNDVAVLPTQTRQRTNFTFQVTGTPPGREQVELVFGLAGAKTGQPVKDCVAYTFLLSADDEQNRYITDCPTGCTADYDLNQDERWDDSIPSNPFDPIDFLNQGEDETAIVYGDLTDTSFRGPECPNCGNDAVSFTGPWNFNVDDEGFTTGVSPLSALAPTTTQISNWGEDQNWDNVLQPAEDIDPDGQVNQLDQNWDLGGGCGFVSSNGTNRGLWHTGTIGTWLPSHTTAVCRPDDSVCEQYDVMIGTTGQEYWFQTLRTPTIHPVRLGTDADGFEWQAQIRDWSWNWQMDFGDTNTTMTWEFDLDTQTANPIALGDDFIGGLIFGNAIGAISGGQNSIFGGAFAFNPTIDDSTDLDYGDEKLGTKGNNRDAHRGCYFNNLDDIAGDGPGLTAADRQINPPRPIDDDCDNNFDLVDGCPGDCGVDDDGNGAIDDPFEICPCRVCEAASPRAGQACLTAAQCNPSPGTTFQCVDNTDVNGVPAGFGDDICGNGQTDENVLADFGTAAGLRQIRNADISMLNGVASGGRGAGDPRFNTLDDFFGPTGDSWAGELGFLVAEPEGSDAAIPSYGLGVDDMVVEWVETHPIDDTAAVCNSVSNPDYDGQCARIALGVAFNTNDGDGEIPVTVVDFNASTTENAVDCNGDGTAAEVQVQAFSEAERIPELICLEPASPGSSQYKGTIKTTTRIRALGDGLVYLAWNGNDTPSVTARYIDKNDGVHGFNGGPDGQPGIAGFDDDGDGTPDNPEELCPETTNLGPGRSPHEPGHPARYSDDECGCPDNIVDSTFAAFDPADLLFVNYTIDDSAGDNDGWPDPGEEVTLNITVRNLSDFALENVELLIASDSAAVDCVTDDRVIIPSLAKRGDPGDQVETSTVGDSFSFVAATGVTRQSISERFGSEWTISMRALGKANPSTSFDQDIPISGTLAVQTFFIPHNLSSAGSPSAIPDFVDDFEAYTGDADLRANWLPRVTGDDPEELDGTHCQTNDPFNPFGNNTDPNDFCELGEGYDNTEEHWHLNGAFAGVGDTVCESPFGCPDGGRSMPGGSASLSNSNTVDADGSVIDDGFTIDHNRMNWVQYKNNFQLGLGNPELEYWTQMSITDNRLFGQLSPPFAFDAGLVYVCVDDNDNNECDTGQVGSHVDNGERWEPVRAYFSPEQNFRQNNFINCMYDPSDDGSTEDEFFPNALDQGPSSTCFPGNPVDTCVGRTRDEGTGFGAVGNSFGPYCWPETGAEDTEIGQAGAITAAEGAFGPGTWIRKAYKLERFRGQKVLIRFHVSPGGLPGIENTAAILGPFGGNRDDGWFIDNVKVTGLSSDFALALDNDGTNPGTCGGLANCTAVDSSLAVLPFPRNDRNGNPKPALYCSDQNPDECDFDLDGTVDSTAADVTADAPGRPFVLEARFSTSDKCLGGALEYRYTDLTSGLVIRDWLTDPVTLIDPTTTTTYRLEVRCSSSTTCLDQTDVTINAPFGPSVCRTADLTIAADKQSITWAADPNAACPALFDTLRGDAPDFSTGTCLENDGADTSSTDATTPAAGAAFWYLTRHDADTYSTGAAGEQDRSGITGCP